MDTISQNKKVLAYLSEVGEISRNLAYRTFAIGRLGARIQDLKYDGLLVNVADETEEEKKRNIKNKVLRYAAHYGKKIGKPKSQWSDYFYTIIK